MKKRVVAKAQKWTRRNIAKYNDRMKSLIHRKTEAKKEKRFYKDTKPNRNARRIWDRIIGKGEIDVHRSLDKHRDRESNN